MIRYTLSELCAIIGEALDDSLAPSYWVKAEISSLSEKGGHLYLELVESSGSTPKHAYANVAAKMRATCWSGTKEMLMAYFESETGQRLQAGMSVLVEAEVQWHPVYGLSLSIVGIDPSYTLGDIAQQRQKTIAQLQADGLLDAQQLLPLPTLIKRIAVISSESAAGYEDFKHQLDNSGFAFETQLFAATMQGEGAEKSILAALEEISQQPVFDCVAIIRGGGATTDLSCFDRYTLCAVCAQFELPILSGIGHTRDVSIDEQMARIADLLVRLQRTSERQILIRRHKVEMLEQRLEACNPERIYRKGYSLLTKNGKIIRSANELRPGDTIESHLIDGTVQSTVNR